MAIYKKSAGMSGAWLKGSEVADGTKAKLVSETTPQESEYQGRPRTQNIAKVRLQGDKGEAKNVNINKPSINALVDAFGEDSKSWMGQVLTIHVETVVIGGKRLKAMYFVPEGYEVSEDSGGYLVIVKKEEAKGEIQAGELPPVEYHEDNINPEDIPW